MEVDYELYAEGEALLGWLNATVQLAAPAGFDADATLKTLAAGIQQRLAGSEIAHLKMTLNPDSGLGDIAAVNLVRSDFVPELSLTLEEPVRERTAHHQLPRRSRARGSPRCGERDDLRAEQRRIFRATGSPRIFPPRQTGADPPRRGVRLT